MRQRQIEELRNLIAHVERRAQALAAEDEARGAVGSAKSSEWYDVAMLAQSAWRASGRASKREAEREDKETRRAHSAGG